jgi:hypothetical protein
MATQLRFVVELIGAGSRAGRELLGVDPYSGTTWTGPCRSTSSAR